MRHREQPSVVGIDFRASKESGQTVVSVTGLETFSKEVTSGQLKLRMLSHGCKLVAQSDFRAPFLKDQTVCCGV